MKSIVTTDPDIMSGTPCFAGTRVPVEIFFDYMSKSYTIDEFLADFPTVSREQLLHLIKSSRTNAESTAVQKQPA